ncbi:MAG: hypothetical protein AAF682_07825 [Planctomycetota bacterium]
MGEDHGFARGVDLGSIKLLDSAQIAALHSGAAPHDQTPDSANPEPPATDENPADSVVRAGHRAPYTCNRTRPTGLREAAKTDAKRSALTPPQTNVRFDRGQSHNSARTSLNQAA